MDCADALTAIPSVKNAKTAAIVSLDVILLQQGSVLFPIPFPLD
jgi:hypothetical protein